MIIFGLPRTGSRSVSNFFIDAYDYKFQEGGLALEKFPVSGNRLHHWTPDSLDPSKPIRPNLIKKELLMLLNPKYENYTWISLMRHPVTRLKSMLNWFCNAGSKNMNERGFNVFSEPNQATMLCDYHAMHILDKIRPIDYWLRLEYIKDDILSIPQIAKDINSSKKTHEALVKNFDNNLFTQPDYDKTRVSINDFSSKVLDYLYEEYKYIYKQFNYEKIPRGYNFNENSEFNNKKQLIHA